MRLVRGAGSETKGACWMSALHYYTRTDRSWSDHHSCVSGVVRVLCIELNDWCNDDERGALIGPHLFAPVGTATGLQDEIARARLCAERATAWAGAAAAAEAARAAAEVEVVLAARQRYQRELLQLILDCCAIGQPVEVPKACSREEVLALCR